MSVRIIYSVFVHPNSLEALNSEHVKLQLTQINTSSKDGIAAAEFFGSLNVVSPVARTWGRSG